MKQEHQPKTIIIYHRRGNTDCIDGVASAWTVAKVHPDAEIIGMTYESPLQPKLRRGDTVIIVDFSFPRFVTEQWQRSGINVICLDHHETAERELSGRIGHNWLERLVFRTQKPVIRFDMNECGATLAWRYFFPKYNVPLFLQYIEDRDNWRWFLPGSDEINAAISERLYQAIQALPDEPTWKVSFRVFDQLNGMSEFMLKETLINEGLPLTAERRQLIDAIMASDRVVEAQVQGKTVPSIQLTEPEDRFYSHIGMAMYRKYPQAPFVLVVTSNGGHHLRSDRWGNNTNVAEIAEALGGGGHRNASGYPG